MRAGFREAAGPALAATAKKRAVEHENGRIAAEDRWIVGVGTCVTFSGKAKIDALAEILERFDPADPLAVRRHVFGHYAVAVRLGSRIFAFCDEIASFDLFFWKDLASGRFVLGNFLSDFLAHERIVLQADDFAALRAAYHGESGLDRESLIPGVLRVRGGDLVEITLDGDGAAAELRTGEPFSPIPEPCDLPTGVRRYVDLGDRVFQALPAFRTIAINCTGGLDTRLLLATARKHGLRPTLLYGRGNSRMSNTRIEDQQLARQIAQDFGWPLSLMDWRQDHPHDREARLGLHRRYGFKQPYGATSGLLAAFEGDIASYPELQLGGYNPAFSNQRPWEWGETLSMAEFLDRFSAEYARLFRTETARHAYLDLLGQDMRALAERRGVDLSGDRIARQGFVALLSEAHAAKGAFNVNAFNQFCFYLAPFFTSDLYEALLAAPSAWREGDGFQLRAIQANCPEALDIPIFSGQRRYRLDAAQTSMVADAPSRRSRYVRRLRQVLSPFSPSRRSAEGSNERGYEDRTPAFEASLHATLIHEHPSSNIDPQAFSRKNLRAVHRYITAREIGGAF